MARYLFNLPDVQPSQKVRVDTASGSDSPATGLTTVAGDAISSTLTGNHGGELPEIFGPDGVATLYLKTLTYSGAVTGSPVTVPGYNETPVLPGSAAFRPIQAPDVTTLATPYVVFHRGITKVLPENTIEGIRAAIANGAQVIKIDAQLLNDGTFGVMHDDTVDRVTTASANCADTSSASWQQLVVDAGSWFGGGWGNLTAPLLSEVLDRFAGRVSFIVEAKRTGTGQALAALLASYNLPFGRLVYQTSFWTDVPYGPAAGLATAFVDTTGGSQTPAALAAAGVTILAVDQSNAGVTSGLITSVKAAGVKQVHGYTPVLQKDVEAFLAKGGDALHSDDAVYAFGRHNGFKYKRTTDPFKSQTFYHGHKESTGSVANRGIFTAPDEWGYAETTNAGFKGAAQGWACPIKGLVGADTFTIALTVDFQAVAGGDTSRWGGGFICANDDYDFSDAGTVTGTNGYRWLLSAAGALNLYRYTNGTASATSAFASTALTLPQTVPLTIAVSPTQIVLTRTDTGQANTFADATFRGGFFWLGVSGATARFKAITIS